MREVVFRGKQKDLNRWFYGYLLRQGTRVRILQSCEPGELIDGILPDSIGEYIGIKDKNGVKIFEGDILRCDYDFEYGIGIHTREQYYNMQ